MSERWQEIELGDHCEILSGKRIFADDYVDEGIPFYRSTEIINKALGQFTHSELFITQERFDAIKERFGAPKKGDLLISAVGNRSGIPYCVREDFDFYFKDGNLIWFRNFSNDLFSPFLEYYLNSPIGKNQVESMMIGSAQKALTISGVKKIRLNLPTLPEQKTIAHILGTLDDKIEVNRQMNQTLEAIAQALFKSWFVDFDPVMDNALAAGNPIPDELQVMAEKRQLVPDSKKLKTKNPELATKFPSSFVFNETLGKWIPEGWINEQVENVLNRLKVSNRFKKEDLIAFGKVPVYEQGVNILMGYHNGKPDIKATSDDPAFIFGDHTCVMKLGLTPFSISANVIALKGNIRNTIWTYFSLLGIQSFEEYRRHWMELAVKHITVAPKYICDSFEFKVKDFLLKQVEIQNEIETLTQLRDRLLPELISGKTRVSL